MTDACPYIATTDEGTSYCRLAEQTASATKLEDRLEALEHKLNTLRADHLRMANAVANQLLPSDRTKFFVDTMRDEDSGEFGGGVVPPPEQPSQRSDADQKLIDGLLNLARIAVSEAMEFAIECGDENDAWLFFEYRKLKRMAEQ